MARKRRVYQIELVVPHLLNFLIRDPNGPDRPLAERCIGTTKAAAEKAARRLSRLLLIATPGKPEDGWKEMAQGWYRFVIGKGPARLDRCWRKWVTNEGWTLLAVEPSNEWYVDRCLRAIDEANQKMLQGIQSAHTDSSEPSNGRLKVTAVAKRSRRFTDDGPVQPNAIKRAARVR